ncbi:MAG TPA: acyl-homoserine-lactone synthase, partial [Flavobacterium sp.]|nr:acyl-homoserine-lactone synthase [Flavobacterium sp.]
MKILRELQLKVNGNKRVLYFGMPDTEDELNQMYTLRYKVYAKYDYIDTAKFEKPIDIDKLDKDGSCIYFITKLDDTVIGSVRLIQTENLPINTTCFKFDEPSDMAKLTWRERGEIGRLVVRPYNKEERLPRNIILLFLIDSLVTYSRENNIKAVYAFVTAVLKGKLQRLNIPINYIEDYEQIYPVDGTLYKYFHQEHNPILPVYFV